MSPHNLWMVSTKLKALDAYRNRITKDDIVYVTAVTQADTKETALEKVKAKLIEINFEFLDLVQIETYDEDTFSCSDACISYGIEEAVNEVEAGLPDTAFGFFVTQEHIDHQSRIWFAYTHSVPLFEGVLQTDGSEWFADCILVHASTKQFAVSQIKDTFLKHGQTNIEFLLLEEISNSNIETIVSKVNNQGLKTIVENSIEDVLSEVQDNKKPSIISTVIMDNRDE